jgi:hypothetical protein
MSRGKLSQVLEKGRKRLEGELEKVFLAEGRAAVKTLRQEARAEAVREELLRLRSSWKKGLGFWFSTR